MKVFYHQNPPPILARGAFRRGCTSSLQCSSIADGNAIRASHLPSHVVRPGSYLRCSVRPLSAQLEVTPAQCSARRWSWEQRFRARIKRGMNVRVSSPLGLKHAYRLGFGGMAITLSRLKNQRLWRALGKRVSTQSYLCNLMIHGTSVRFRKSASGATKLDAKSAGITNFPLHSCFCIIQDHGPS